MRSTWAIVLGTVSIVLFAVAAVTYLEVLGRPVADVVALLAAIGAPTIVSLFALAKGEQTNTTVNKVQEQTNGVMTDLHERVATVEDAINPDTPPSVPKEVSP